MNWPSPARAAFHHEPELRPPKAVAAVVGAGAVQGAPCNGPIRRVSSSVVPGMPEWRRRRRSQATYSRVTVPEESNRASAARKAAPKRAPAPVTTGIWMLPAPGV